MDIIKKLFYNIYIMGNYINLVNRWNKYLSTIKGVDVYFELWRCDPFNSGNSTFVVNVVKEAPKSLA